METKIKEIIERKKNGVDCTEEESAELKGFLKEFIPLPNSGDIQMIEDIQLLFPLEYGEVLDEWENLSPDERHEKIRESYQ
jgi:hypothetical protein